MSEPFIAEIRIFAGNFAPRGWAFCSGQLLPISQNTALFSLIGTTYGGDGRTTTALPNLQGRAPMHPGRGPGLTSRRLGQRGGSQSETITMDQMASHTHQMTGRDQDDDSTVPTDHWLGVQSTIYRTPSNLGAMAATALPNMGGNQSHTNMQPYLTLNFIIALVGTYPSRS